jgi:hypothetical protein
MRFKLSGKPEQPLRGAPVVDQPRQLAAIVDHHLQLLEKVVRHVRLKNSSCRDLVLERGGTERKAELTIARLTIRLNPLLISSA